jgi:hypothetical protein
MYKRQSHTLLVIVTGLVFSLLFSCQKEIVLPTPVNNGTRQQASDSTYLPDLNVVVNINSSQSSGNLKKGDVTNFSQIDCGGSETLFVGGMSMKEAMDATAEIMSTTGACSVAWTGMGYGSYGITVTRHMPTTTTAESWDIKWDYPGSSSTWIIGGANSTGTNPVGPDLGNQDGDGATDAEWAIVYTMSPGEQATYYANRDIARDRLNTLLQACGGAANGDGTGNAFLHAYWTALNARFLGPELALRLVSAHEAWNGNPTILANMDQFNDNVGLRIARYNPNASIQQLSSLVENSIFTGHGVIVINNTMYDTTFDVCD